MRVSQFRDAFVNRVCRTHAENENRSYERPEEPLFAVTERMFSRRWSLVEAQSQQQENLVRGISERVKRLGHHPGRAGHGSCNELQNRN
jgi:hypothetical protein